MCPKPGDTATCVMISSTIMAFAAFFMPVSHCCQPYLPRCSRLPGHLLPKLHVFRWHSFLCMHAHTSTHLHTYAYTCTERHTHTHMHTHRHIYIHACLLHPCISCPGVDTKLPASPSFNHLAVFLSGNLFIPLFTVLFMPLLPMSNQGPNL